MASRKCTIPFFLLSFYFLGKNQKKFLSGTEGLQIPAINRGKLKTVLGFTVMSEVVVPLLSRNV